MRIAISAGHGKGDPGAVNKTLGLEEHREARRICEELEQELQLRGFNVFVVEYNSFSLKEKIAEVNRAHAESPIGHALEIHFNSNAGEPAHGTEVLHLSVKNKDLAEHMSNKIALAIGTVSRGAKQRMNLGWLKQTKPPALIVEVLFINNDSEALKVNQPDFAKNVAVAIAESL